MTETELDIIIKNGTILNEKQNLKERLQIKRDILLIVSKMNDNIFIMNLKMFNWKQKIITGETVLPKTGDDFEKYPDWLLDPLYIFCNNIEESARHISNELFALNHVHVKARNDIYCDRLNIDVDFEVVGIIVKTNNTLVKNINTVDLFGAKLNFNGIIMLPILLYDYIMPKFSYLNWKEELEIEPFLWKSMVEKWIKTDKTVYKREIIENSVSEKILNIIKNEKKGSYIFTGNYTYFMICKQNDNKTEYLGDFHIYHENPEEFIKLFPDFKVKEELHIYYFEKPSFKLLYNNVPVLTVYPLNYQMNYINIGGYNHTNYHGVLLFLLIEMLKADKKEADEICLNIGYLIKIKNSFPNHNYNHNYFEILQNICIGPKMTPHIEFKKKEWNKELTFFHRPDMINIEIIESDL